jgi:hypothetical protein
LHEVYFEYDDELEYIARARDLEQEVTRWAGTTEMTFPVIVSALFDSAGVLKAVRLVTDPRPDYRNDTIDADLQKRDDAYLLGSRMAARFNIDAKRDCTALPPAEGESAVGDQFIKQSCELVDRAQHRKIDLEIDFYRKPGQSAFNPQMPTQLTQGPLSRPRRAVGHRGVLESRGIELGIVKVALAEACAREVGVREICAAENGAFGISIGQIGADKARIVAFRTDEAGLTELGAIELGRAQERKIERCSGQVGASQDGVGKARLAQVDIAQDGLAQIGAGETGGPHQGIGQVGARQTGGIEIGGIKHGVVKMRTGKIGAAQISLVEIGTGQVGASKLGTR